MNRQKRARSYRTHINLAPMDFAVRQAFISQAMALGEWTRAADEGGIQVVVTSEEYKPKWALLDATDEVTAGTTYVSGAELGGDLTRRPSRYLSDRSRASQNCRSGPGPPGTADGSSAHRAKLVSSPLDKTRRTPDTRSRVKTLLGTVRLVSLARSADGPSASQAGPRQFWGTLWLMKDRGWHSRDHLPHYDDSGKIQFLTYNLADAIPARLLQQWKDELSRTKFEERQRILRR